MDSILLPCFRSGFSLGNDTAFCFGDSLTLNLEGVGTTYLWQDGSNNSNITVSTSGTYWVDVTDANGCSSIDSIV